MSSAARSVGGPGRKRSAMQVKGYLITAQNHLPVPEDWNRKTVQGISVFYHRDIQVLDIAEAVGRKIGVLLGYFFQTSRAGQAGGVNGIYQVDESAGCSGRELIRHIHEVFFGRYIFISCLAGAGEIFLDPLGSLGCVYSKELKCVASTSPVLGRKKYDEDWDSELERLIPNNFFPFELTPHKSVKRLLPNHFLDLETWTSRRHYPAEGDLKNCRTDRELVVKVAEKMRSVIGLFSKSNAAMTLTAGSDNRIVLACAKEFSGDFTFFTNANSIHYDIEISRKISSDLGLKHCFIPHKKSSAGERRLMEELSGYCMDALSLASFPQHRSVLKENVYQLTGAAGEIGRCSYWLASDKRGDVVTPEEILKRLRIVANDELLECAAVWLKEIEHLGVFTILDLLFWEINCGCRAAPNMYPYDSLSLIPIHPFNDITVLTCLLNLTPEYKRSKKLVHDICEISWPELMKYPVNRRMGLKGIMDSTKAGVKNALKPAYNRFKATTGKRGGWKT